MSSTRAAEVAEVLWELKRAEKLATFSTIASRAGFSAGTNGRSVITALKTVRRGWPHLQWWRAINDDGLLKGDSEHATKLRECGFEISAAEGKDGVVTIVSLESHLMTWDESPKKADAVAKGASDGQAEEEEE